MQDLTALRQSQPETPEEPAIKPVLHQSLPDAVVADLRRAIVNGRLAAGERILEIEFAGKLQVSRATLRRALRQLEYEGLVEIVPRRGVVVARMSTEVAAEVCEVRGLLEGCAARAACRTLSEDAIQRLRPMAQAMGGAVRDGDLLRLVELDIAFHTQICEQTPNSRLILQWKQLNSLHAAVLVSRLAHYDYDWQLITDLHLQLCDVLGHRDPDEAESAIREHYAVRDRDEGRNSQPADPATEATILTDPSESVEEAPVSTKP